MEDGVKHIAVAPLVCPECGSSEVIFREDMPYYHRIYGIDDQGNILISLDGDAGDPDASGLVCLDCYHDWEPSNWDDIKFTNWSEVAFRFKESE